MSEGPGRRVLMAVLGVTAMLAMAGCLEDEPVQQPLDSDDDADGGDGNTTVGGGISGNGTVSGNGTAGNTTVGGNVTAGGNATFGNETEGGNATVTVYDNRTGEISGTDLLVSGPDDAEEAVTVANGTLTLHLNLSVEGDEVAFYVYPPGCEDDDCRSEVTVTDGQANLTVEAPEEGDWTVVLEPQSSPGGSFEASYELTVAAEVPA